MWKCWFSIGFNNFLIRNNFVNPRALDARNRALGLLELRKSQIDTFLKRILNRIELWSSKSSGSPKSMLFSIQFVIEMNCGAPRVWTPGIELLSLESFGRFKSMLFLIEFFIEISFGAPKGSGGPKSILVFIHLSIEMSFGASRALEVPNRCFSQHKS